MASSLRVHAKLEEHTLYHYINYKLFYYKFGVVSDRLHTYP